MKLAAAVLTLLMTATLAHAAPVIARVGSAPSGEVAQAYGEGFTVGQVEVRALAPHWAGDPRKNEDVWKAALESAQRTGFTATPPATPPKEAVACKVVDATGQVVSFVMPSGWGTEVTVVWMRNAGGDWSAPYVVNLPEPWWMEAGQTARLYGRLLASNRPGCLVVRNGDHYTRASWVNFEDLSYFANSYRIGIQAAGPGEVWIHNGSGGDYGWVRAGTQGGPPAGSRLESPTVYLRDFGAKGDGVADDTAAFEKAFAVAVCPAKLILGPGQYVISRCLRVPPSFSLLGAGAGATTIVSHGMQQRGFPTQLETWDVKGMPNDWYPFVKQSTPLLWLKTNSSLSDLSIENRGDEGVCVLVANPGASCDNISIRNCRIRNQVQPARVDGGYNPADGCIWVPNMSRDLLIADNTLETVSGALSCLGRADRAKIARNQMYQLSDQQGDLCVFRGGLVECVIEDNRLYNSKRGMVMQQGRPCIYHNYFSRNTQEWVERGGNANETLLMEGGVNYFCGHPTAADATTITVAGAGWKPGAHKERYVLVLSGRGLGEYGRIADNTADTLTLVAPWRVPVDGTTTLTIGDYFAENAFVSQNDRRSGAAFQFWGNCLANTVDGLHSYEAEGVIFWAINTTDMACFSYYNEVLNSYMIGEGHVEFRGGAQVDKAKRYVEAPVLAGNAIRDTAMVDYRSLPDNQPGPYWKWYEYWMEPFAAVDFWNSPEGPGYRNAVRQPERVPADAPPTLAYNLIDGCLFQRGERGGRIDPGSYHTIFHEIKLDGVQTPWEDKGEGTVLP